MTNSEGSFIWYELMTPNPDASKVFYDAVIGWNIESESSEPGGAVDYRMIIRADGGNAGGMLKLDQAMMDRGAGPAWLAYLYVADVDARVAAIESDGGKILMPPHDAPGIGRFAMVTDPVGVPFYLMKPISPDGGEGQSSDVFSVDQPQHIRWNELATTDPDGMIDFYARHFGWKAEGEMDMGEFGKYRFIHHDGVRIGAIMPKMPQHPTSVWCYYIGVDDIDRAANAVVEQGGQVVHSPQEIPGGEFTLKATDPQGASFGLVGPRDKGSV